MSPRYVYSFLRSLFPSLSSKLEAKAFEVLRFRNGRDDRMIGRLHKDSGPPQGATRVKRRLQDNVLKRPGIHVVRAAEGGQSATSLEQFQRTQMNFFVTAQRILDRSAVACKRGWIEDNNVKARNELFVRGGRRVVFQPIKDVGSFERAVLRQTVRLSVTGSHGDGVLALVHSVDVSGATACRVQREPTEERETVEDLGTGCQLPDQGIILLLVEVQACLVSLQQVGRERKAIKFHLKLTLEAAVKDGV